MTDPVSTHTAKKSYADGYNAALNDCIVLLRKWFWASNKDARECEAEIRSLKRATEAP